MKEVIVYSDGACRGNPGPGGWGALLSTGRHEKEIWGGVVDTTNNRMELTAVIEALKTLNRPCRLTIVTDSKYVMQGATEWMSNWKKRDWKTASRKPVKNKDLWIPLEDLLASHTVEWQWVKGHDGHPGNEKADELANRGVDELLEFDQ